MLFHDIDPLVLPGGTSLEFRIIPPVSVQEQAQSSGRPLSFLMGARGQNSAEEPRHRVLIPQPFYLGTTPITQEQLAAWTRTPAYRAWQSSRPEEERHHNHFAGRPRRPAENLSWYAACAFTQWLNDLADAGHLTLPKGLRASLPDEACWEYACRAGTSTDYWSGGGEEAWREIGWFQGNAQETMDVAQLAASPWGRYDMHGNVWEWCADVWDARPYCQRPDGWCAGPRVITEIDPLRVVRGGSWYDPAGGCRAAYRDWGHPLDRNRYQGFRVLLSAPGPVAEPEERPGAEAGREPAARDERSGERKAGAVVALGKTLNKQSPRSGRSF